MQTVGNDADVIVRHIGNAVGIVLGKLIDHLDFRLLMQTIVRFVFPHHAVTFVLDGLFRLHDGEVEGSRKLGIFPRFAFFYVEDAAIVVRHGPYDNDDGDNDGKDARQNVTPGYVLFDVQTVHLRIKSNQFRFYRAKILNNS